MAGFFRFVLAVTVLLLNALPCVAQTSPLSISTSPNGTLNSNVDDLDIGCTRASFLMDPHTAKRLSSMFCDRLLANFPKFMGMMVVFYTTRPPVLTSSGGNYSMPGYPRDLALLPGSANFTSMEKSGLIAEFEFIRGSGIEINTTIITQGTKEQCFRDNCLKILGSIVDRCEQRNAYQSVIANNYQANGTHTITVALTLRSRTADCTHPSSRTAPIIW